MSKLAFGNDECSRCGQRHPIGQECDPPGTVDQIPIVKSGVNPPVKQWPAHAPTAEKEE